MNGINAFSSVQRECSLAFQLAVVHQIENNIMSIQQAESKYGLEGTVAGWLARFGK